MTAAYLGIDCGTQGTKAIVVDEYGKTLGTGRAAHALIERSSGAREQDPAWWVKAMREAMSSALADGLAADVRAIAVSGQQHGLVVLDESLEVIRPAKLWNDTETAPENVELIERLGGEAACLERYGIVLRTGYTVSKLLWLAKHEPDNFARIRHILLPHEYLNFWLTGQLKAERGDASGTGYFDVRTLTWATDVLDLIDGGTGQLSAALPDLVSPNESVGKIRPKVALEFGLPANCVVAVGGGDNMMGAIGTGNLREGVVTLSLGTSGTVYSYRSAPPEDKTGCVAPFCASSGGWMPLVCTMNATNVVTQMLALLHKTVEDIDPALANTGPGADGLTLIPFLNGERAPDLPSARGSLIGISTTNFTADHMIRASVEGVSFGLLDGLGLIVGNTQTDRIRLIGGGSRSAGWRQLLADATGATIEVPIEQEAGCLGAAMQAACLDANLNGQDMTLEKFAETWVRLDETRTTLPDRSKAASYSAAISRYRETLRSLYQV